MTTTINYQRIYEEEISDNLKDALTLGERYFETTADQQRFIEDLVDAGYRLAVGEALDREVLEDTAELAGDMGTQLYNFANLVQSYLKNTK